MWSVYNPVWLIWVYNQLSEWIISSLTWLTIESNKIAIKLGGMLFADRTQMNSFCKFCHYFSQKKISGTLIMFLRLHFFVPFLWWCVCKAQLVTQVSHQIFLLNWQRTRQVFAQNSIEIKIVESHSDAGWRVFNWWWRQNSVNVIWNCLQIKAWKLVIIIIKALCVAGKMQKLRPKKLAHFHIMLLPSGT